MTVLAEIVTQGPLTEIAVGVITGLILFVWRKIEKGAMIRKHKRQLKRALLEKPPVDADEQLAELDAQERSKSDIISKSITPIIKNLFKGK